LSAPLQVTVWLTISEMT